MDSGKTLTNMCVTDYKYRMPGYILVTERLFWLHEKLNSMLVRSMDLKYKEISVK